MKNFRRQVLNSILIILGILSAGLGLKGFLMSSRFIDGGVTGISMLLSDVLGWPLSLLILVINLPFIALAYRQIGRAFAIRSTLAITGLALALAFIKYPDVTPDKLLTAVFGGFFIGAGIGLAIRGGAVLDGTEVAALLVSKSSNFLKVGDVILLLNVLIFSAAAFFLGIEPALYSMLTYFAASKTVDFLIHGLEEYTAVTIIAERSGNPAGDHSHPGAGSNRLQGSWRAFGFRAGYFVLCSYAAGNRPSEAEARAFDEGAFIVVQPLADAEGGVLKRLAAHP